MDLYDADPRAVVRFLPGDLLAIAAFVLVGALSHGTLTLQRYAGIFLPFVVGWIVVAPFAGGYDASVRESSRAAIAYAAMSWLGADFLAQLLRGTPFFPGNADSQFFLVALVFGTIALVLARFVTLVVVDYRG
ncbi:MULTISPECIES: DUF3054 domain-containing protein [Halobacterium]|uniref:DUF3054 domain-containing protein n=1 Tax=Halobacterium TaxID=2239 RepID=UPI00073E9DD3|nr:MULTISPECIES: DUF3054 domain-containing protein [Halobacterium]MCG1003101.1 DUF3054 domain-containing protein [Halobacterium noricense]